MDTAARALSPSPSLSVSRTELAALLGRPDAPLVLDVRRTPRFEQSDRLVATAGHCAPEDVAAFAAGHPPRDVVVYCVYGHEVSAGAASQLRQAGWNARFLAGGIEGGEPGVDTPQALQDWAAQPLPLIRKRPDLGLTGTAGSRWITRERPKVDRVACPWLIRRFIDPQAQFFFAPPAQVLSEAQRLGATAFDIEGGPVTHQWERCSFDALLRLFELRVPALDRLATIVRGADTDRLGLAPQSGGLLAMSLGLSRLLPDDHAMLEAAMPLYDALFEWCRNGADETHTWKAHETVGSVG